MRELGLLILQTGLQKNDYFPKSQNGQKWEVEETVVVMFTFEKCTYDELQVIRYEADLLLSGWTMLEKEYIDETEKIYDEDGKMVALINYYFLNENKERMMIALFEVFKPYRNRGLGKRIIAQFFQDYHGEVHLEPSGEESESFWKQCGFESGCYLDMRVK